MNLLQEFEAGNFAQVVGTWEDDQNQLSTDPEAAYIVAAAQLRLGNYEAACQICEELVGVFSNNSNFLAMYAAILRRLGLFERAEIIFRQALDLNPSGMDVRNNFSNLLIDQGKFDEAKHLLNQLIKEEPNNTDAINNLNRLELLIEENTNRLRDTSTSSGSNIFGDPLDEAFEVKEVMQCGAKPGSFTAAVENLLPEPQKGDLEEADLEMLNLANQQIKTNQHLGALQLLHKLRERKGSHSSLYKSASDASIGLKRFKDAEIYGLLSFVNGDKSIANFLNLASLSAMRKDQIMARHWLVEASNVDSTNSLYLQAKDLLFPNGKARDIDSPFI